ncbi:SGNH/GDSL hydrolase family protein [Aerococcus urinaeequi]|uniref:SGNH/GDSL hydrolase family protein n=1 Tax=Aerococcus urinaeequi TaxID=51665 RepID=UPI003D6C0693
MINLSKFKLLSRYVGLILLVSVLLISCEKGNNVGGSNNNSADEAVSEEGKSVENKNIEDMNIVFLGDSITQNFESNGTSFPDIVKQETGANTINMGFGGTAMSKHSSEAFDAFSFYQLSEAVTQGDYTLQEDALKDDEIPTYFEKKLEELENIDWQNVDIIVIEYGANDWGKPIINESDTYDVNTFMGAGRSGMDKLLAKYPHLQFMMVPGIYRYWPDYNNVDTDSSVNDLGLHPYEYSDAMSDLAKEYKFPAVDSLYGLGINKYNRELYFDGVDGTHPNQAGTNKLGNLVANTLMFYY